MEMRKYPRTPHLSGSRLQPGDEDLPVIPRERLADLQPRGRFVVEEKEDGSNAGLGFTAGSRLVLQSRSHVLRGGPRERLWDLFKAWAAWWREQLWAALGSRYLVYGEWLYAKHTIFYDDLPHYFL